MVSEQRERLLTTLDESLFCLRTRQVQTEFRDITEAFHLHGLSWVKDHQMDSLVNPHLADHLVHTLALAL